MPSEPAGAALTAATSAAAARGEQQPRAQRSDRAAVMAQGSRARPRHRRSPSTRARAAAKSRVPLNPAPIACTADPCKPICACRSHFKGFADRAGTDSKHMGYRAYETILRIVSEREFARNFDKRAFGFSVARRALPTSRRRAGNGASVRNARGDAREATPWISSTATRRSSRSRSSRSFMDEHVYPNEATYYEQHAVVRRRSLADPADHRGAQGQGARGRALEPLPAREQARRRLHQPRVRAAVRGDGPRRLRARGVQLRGARHRQHGGARALRERRRSRSAGSSRCSTGRSARPSR